MLLVFSHFICCISFSSSRVQNTSLPNSSFILSKPYLPHFIYSTSVIALFILYYSYSHSSNIPINSLWPEKKNFYLAGIQSIDKKITVNTFTLLQKIKKITVNTLPFFYKSCS